MLFIVHVTPNHNYATMQTNSYHLETHIRLSDYIDSISLRKNALLLGKKKKDPFSPMLSQNADVTYW